MKKIPDFFYLIFITIILVLPGCKKRMSQASLYEPEYQEDYDKYAMARKIEANKTISRPRKVKTERKLSKAAENPEAIDDEMRRLEEELHQLENDESSKYWDAGYVFGKKLVNPDLADMSTYKVPPAPKKPPKRMVFHDADIKTRSTDPETLIKSAIELVKSFEGFLESRSENTISLRIPIKHFRLAFDSLLHLGEIINYSQTSTDITEEFYDTEARIAILQKTIARLREILTHTEKQEEQIKILNQIKRLSEELEEKITQRKVLSKKAQFSRIVFSVHEYAPSGTHSSMVKLDGFTWIWYLDPFTQRQKAGAQRFEPAVPDGMVKVRKPNLWFAQSAGGSKFWTAKIENRPNGTTDFWLEAIRYRIRKDYYSDTTYSAGKFRVLQFRSLPGEHFVYSIAVQQKDKHLYIAEMFFPDSEQFERFHKKVTSALEGVAL